LSGWFGISGWSGIRADTHPYQQVAGHQDWQTEQGDDGTEGQQSEGT